MTRRLRASEVDTLGSALLQLQHAAYAIEAKLIGDTRIPPLHETEQELLASGLWWIATFEDTRLIGAVGYTIEKGVVDLDRLIVAPDEQRKGGGTGLVAKALDLAPSAVVSTGRFNTPARMLYERLGFTHDTDIETVPGLWISQYSRSPANF